MAKYAILQSFYASKVWINLKQLLYFERGCKCEECSKFITKSIDAIGHHKNELTPENVSDVMISLNPENIKIVCFDCHNKIEGRFGYNIKAERKVYLVYGSPFAGKKTFIKQRMQRGDIIVDMDMLYAAVSGLPSYDKPDNLLSNVMGIHSVLLDNIKTRYGKWKNAWIIGGYQDKYKRDKIANDLGAELVFIDTTREDCLLRLEQDEARRYRQDEWKAYINKWFDSYTE